MSMIVGLLLISMCNLLMIVKSKICEIPDFCVGSQSVGNNGDLTRFEELFVMGTEGYCKLLFNDASVFTEVLKLDATQYLKARNEALLYFTKTFGIDFYHAKADVTREFVFHIPGAIVSPVRGDCVNTVATNQISTFYGTQVAETIEGFFVVQVTNADKFNTLALKRHVLRRDYRNGDTFYVGHKVMDFPFPSMANDGETRAVVNVYGLRPFRVVDEQITFYANATFENSRGVFTGNLHSLVILPGLTKGDRSFESKRTVVTLDLTAPKL